MIRDNADTHSLNDRVHEQFIAMDTVFETVAGGRFVEETAEMVAKANEELQNAKRQLEETMNEMRTITGILFPELLGVIEELRSKRQTLTRESNELLMSLKDIRKFFIAREHNEEKEKLVEFVSLMERLQALQRNGILDAITDAVLRLAVNGTENVRK